MFSFPLLLTVYAGFTHAFEADHLLAVSNIVSQRSSRTKSLKDGMYWGLGHASIIFAVGILMIVLKFAIPTLYFRFLEGLVGAMLIALAMVRLRKLFLAKKVFLHGQPHQHAGSTHHHFQLFTGPEATHQHPHSLAFGVGLVHGLAGSGALMIMVMSQMKAALDGLAYLLLFGGGCIAGMVLASGIFSLPFAKGMMQARMLQRLLIIASSLLCLLYGGKLLFQNLLA